MSIVKRIALAVVSILLLAGGTAIGREATPANRLVVRMFIHYLMGSGTPMEVVIPRAAGCPPSLVGGDFTMVWSTYNNAYKNALGHFTCEYQDGVLRAHDVYDFKYEGDPKICSRLLMPSKHGYASNVGRCIVGTGVGKPYPVAITVLPE